MFGRGRAYGPRASLQQWGRDVGHHQDNWDPYGGDLFGNIVNYIIPDHELEVIMQVRSVEVFMLFW